MIPSQFSPSPSAASSRLGEILSRLESIEPFEIVRNLTRQPQISKQVAIKLNLEEEMLIKDKANTVPGIA